MKKFSPLGSVSNNLIQRSVQESTFASGGIGWFQKPAAEKKRCGLRPEELGSALVAPTRVT
jgi:hypothetical protein